MNLTRLVTKFNKGKYENYLPETTTKTLEARGKKQKYIHPPY